MRPYRWRIIGSTALRTVLKAPLRCTASTASHSSGAMLKTMRSRRMPATWQRMSSRPKFSTAACTMRRAPSNSATESVLATARPPASVISRTTCAAGPSSCPLPSRLTPASLTTTAAPSSASSSATPRPMPRPAPVTNATCPSSLLPIAILPLRLCVLRASVVNEPVSHPRRLPQPEAEAARAEVVQLVQREAPAVDVDASVDCRVVIKIDVAGAGAEELAVDAPGGVGQQKGDQRRHVLRREGVAALLPGLRRRRGQARDLLGQRRRVAAPVTGGGGGVEARVRQRADGVAGDAVAADIARHRAREADDALRGGGEQRTGGGAEAGVAGEHHHRAA